MFPDLLRSRIDGILNLAPVQIQQLQAHYELLIRWNQTLNLTRVDNLEEAVERHYAESLFLAAHLPAGPMRIADVGSGAGFPGFPVAVARPDCQVTLVESHQRKAVFLREASRGLPNVRVVSLRGEALVEPFDHVISRAVSYKDLTPILKKLAQMVDLLSGEESPSAGMGIDWKPEIALPWGQRRFLRIGTVSKR